MGLAMTRLQINNGEEERVSVTEFKCQVHEAAVRGLDGGGGMERREATLEEGGPNKDGDASALVGVLSILYNVWCCIQIKSSPRGGK